MYIFHIRHDRQLLLLCRSLLLGYLLREFSSCPSKYLCLHDLTTAALSLTCVVSAPGGSAQVRLPLYNHLVTRCRVRTEIGKRNSALSRGQIIELFFLVIVCLLTCLGLPDLLLPAGSRAGGFLSASVSSRMRLTLT